MSSLTLDQKNTKIKVNNLIIENDIAFNFFDQVHVDKRDEMLTRAIYIGVLALTEERIEAFFARTTNDLGTELERLKIMFDLKRQLFYRSTIKGTLAENEIADYLNQYFQDMKINDKAILSGNQAGTIARNKTGDIICEIEGKTDLKLIIECKFDKSIKIGNIADRDISTKTTDTAWSQLLEAEVNRDGRASMIVFDKSLVDSSITKVYDNVGFIPGVGFIAIIDSERNDYSNLIIAYKLARDIALKSKPIDYNPYILRALISRLLKNTHTILSISGLVEANIENNKEILKQINSNLLLLKFDKEYLEKFLEDGILSKKDLLAYYQFDEIKDKYKEIKVEIEKGIEALPEDSSAKPKKIKKKAVKKLNV